MTWVTCGGAPCAIARPAGHVNGAIPAVTVITITGRAAVAVEPSGYTVALNNPLNNDKDPIGAEAAS